MNERENARNVRTANAMRKTIINLLRLLEFFKIIKMINKAQLRF